MSNFYEIVGCLAARTANLRNGGDADAFVYDRHTKFASYIVACFNQIASICGDFIIYLFAAGIDVAVGAVEQTDAHSYSADIEVFLLNHFVGFVDFKNINHDRGMEK